MTTDTTARVSGTIKPLEWRDDAEFCGQLMSYAETEFGLWMVVAYSGRDGRWTPCDPCGNDSDDDWLTAEEAKASAQADYNARILAAIQPDPEPRRNAWSAGLEGGELVTHIPTDPEPETKKNYGNDHSSDPEPQPVTSEIPMLSPAEPQPVDEGLVAMNACLVQLDMLVAESGRGVDWGEEDAFRMGEWFEDADLANIERAKRFVTGLFSATPSSAGMVSVEAAGLSSRDEASEAAKTLLRCNGADLDEWTDGEWGDEAADALRALAGERG